MDAFAESAATPLESTVPQLFARNTAQHPDQPALTAGDRTRTWREADREVRALAAGFAALGLRPGQTAVLLMSNRPEQWLVDVALTHLGAVPTAVLPAPSSEDLRHVTRHSRARAIVLENAQHVRRCAAALRDPNGPEHVVVLDDNAVTDEDPRFLSWSSLLARGRRLLAEDPEVVDRHAAAVRPDDPAAVLYCPDSGGQQNGVVLTHRNVLSAAAARHEVVGAPPHAATVCYLPMAHISERAGSLYGALHDRSHVHFCNGISEVVEALPKIRPQVFCGVPRVWERLAARLRRRPRPRSDAERREALAELGLDALTFAASGGAPISREVLELFAATGLDVHETWGLVETAGSATSNRAGEQRVGTVGRAVPGMEVRLDEDGEVLVRGPQVCRGHLQDDGLVRRLTDADGWLRTGDVGELDAAGHLVITGRKSELIVSSTGDSVAPSAVEDALRAHPLIGHALVFGEGRPHLVALLVLDEEAAPGWAAERGLEYRDLAELARHPVVRGAVDDAVAQANALLGQAGQVRGHRLLERTWGAEGGELSPALKLRRRVIHDKYADELEALYS